MSTYEFDSTYSAITGEPVGGLYLPTVDTDSGIDAEGYDVLIDGMPDNLTTEWRAITGKTGQHGYNGCVMHASETATDEQVREWVREVGGDVFAIVEVGGHDAESPVFDDEPDYCETNGCAHAPAGWAIIYRDAEVSA